MICACRLSFGGGGFCASVFVCAERVAQVEHPYKMGDLQRVARFVGDMFGDLFRLFGCRSECEGHVDVGHAASLCPAADGSQEQTTAYMRGRFRRSAVISFARTIQRAP
jgi:hypothetical protein